MRFSVIALSAFFALGACASGGIQIGGVPIESTLAPFKAYNILRNSDNEAQIAYARRQLEFQANNGNAPASFFFGRALQFGYNMETDTQRAISYYDAVDETFPRARNALIGLLYNESFRTGDGEKVASLLEESLAQDARVQHRVWLMKLLGQAGRTPTDPARALEIAQGLAADDNEDGLLYMASVYRDSSSPLFDEAAALEIYTDLAARDVPSANFLAGLFYLQGRGTLQDRAQADIYFQRGAELGDPNASVQYAQKLVADGPEQDVERAWSLIADGMERRHRGSMIFAARELPERYIGFVQAELIERNNYQGSVDGQQSPELTSAIAAFCQANGVSECTPDLFSRDAVLALHTALSV